MGEVLNHEKRISNYIETFSEGRFFVDDNIHKSEFYIGDIAHALSMQCRYNGHTSRFYSVAEHCILMSDYILKTYGRGSHKEWEKHWVPKMALFALMHDSAEAYLCDMPSPIKANLPDFIKLESIIEKNLAKRFNIRFNDPLIKDLDRRIIIDEREQLFPNTGRNKWFYEYTDLKRLGVTIQGWNPEKSKDEFLKRYTKLMQKWSASGYREI